MSHRHCRKCGERMWRLGAASRAVLLFDIQGRFECIFDEDVLSDDTCSDCLESRGVEVRRGGFRSGLESLSPHDLHIKPKEPKPA